MPAPCRTATLVSAQAEPAALLPLAQAARAAASCCRGGWNGRLAALAGGTQQPQDALLCLPPPCTSPATCLTRADVSFSSGELAGRKRKRGAEDSDDEVHLEDFEKREIMRVGDGSRRMWDGWTGGGRWWHEVRGVLAAALLQHRVARQQRRCPVRPALAAAPHRCWLCGRLRAVQDMSDDEKPLGFRADELERKQKRQQAQQKRQQAPGSGSAKSAAPALAGGAAAAPKKAAAEQPVPRRRREAAAGVAAAVQAVAAVQAAAAADGEPGGRTCLDPAASACIRPASCTARVACLLCRPAAACLACSIIRRGARLSAQAPPTAAGGGRRNGRG